MTIFASLPSFSNLALAHWPISTPAFLLSVAKSASAASSGSVGVSSAITVTPAARAFSIDGTIALESDGVIRMPLAPRVTMFSIAVTCDWLSVSCLPAAVTSSALLASAAACAASFIFTKNGLDSVLVIRPTTILSPPPPPPDDPLPPELPPPLSSPHAAIPIANVPNAQAVATRRPNLVMPLLLRPRRCSLNGRGSSLSRCLPQTRVGKEQVTPLRKRCQGNSPSNLRTMGKRFLRVRTDRRALGGTG